jgi:4-diphosphocytidyl-2-C-methyl-D-erythritol kinase
MSKKSETFYPAEGGIIHNNAVSGYLSPAKVNLFLKVLSRRPDNYHNIVSIVDLISIYDILHIEEQGNGRVSVTDDKGILPEGQENTIYKAIMLLKEKYDVAKGVSVYVEKHIPIGSGLGGPSSNAATILKELPKIWGLIVPNKELMDLGRQIGADVPLFLHGRSCVIKGIGDRIQPIDLPRLWYLIVYPDMVIRSRDVYEGLKIVLTKGANDIKLKDKFCSTLEVTDILENDLEKVAITICPKIKAIKDRLIEAGAVGTLMSGSGSSVYGVFENKEKAEIALSFVDDMGSVFVAHSMQ